MKEQQKDISITGGAHLELIETIPPTTHSSFYGILGHE